METWYRPPAPGTDVGRPEILAQPDGVGFGVGVGVGVGVGEGVGDGPVTEPDLGAPSSPDPEHAGARSASVSNATGMQNSRFIPRPYCMPVANG
jgi:hypothetical protein